MIGILNYGAGNLKSIRKGLEKSGGDVKIVNGKELKNLDALVIPGVGAFGDAITKIKPYSISIKEFSKEKPIFGICLGLQLFATESEEGGLFKGLNLVPGRVVRFGKNLKVPQMGWSQIKIKKVHPFLEGIKSEDYFYFAHSYFIKPKNNESIVATTNYGIDFASIVAGKNIFATQFHPEKSDKLGLNILENFVRYLKC